VRTRYSDFKDLLLSIENPRNPRNEKMYFSSLKTHLDLMSEERKTFSPEADRQEMTMFRNELLGIIHESVFCKYVYDKPLGYCGDYMTQEMIWFGITEGGEKRYSGFTSRGGMISSFTFSMENPRANVARVRYIQKKIRKAGPNIASIGCGSCIELWGMEESLRDKNHIFLLDIDGQALKRAREKIPRDIPQLEIVQDNILKYIARMRHKHELESMDLIYCMGLIDYFTHKSAKRIVQDLWYNVKPGGSLVISNAHPGNPTRLWMEYGGDWFLSYKTSEEMLAMVDGLPELHSVDLELDEFGVYQYLDIRKG
jgi:extracellular factor (EF) 3-hydroxypalmitic acid methyl ester biosynthesis protein